MSDFTPSGDGFYAGLPDDKTADDAAIAIDDLPPPWGLGLVVAGYFGSVFLTLLFSSVMLTAAPGIAKGVSGVVVSSVGLWVGFGLTFLVATRSCATWSDRARAVGLRVAWKDPLVGLPAGIATQLVAVPILYLLVFRFVQEQDVSEAAKSLISRGDGFGIVVLTVVVGFGAPFMEELLFRGLLQRASVAALGPWLGVPLVATLFALTHFQLLQLPGLLLAGLVFGTLAQVTGRLGPAIWAHVGFNLTTVAVIVSTAS